jgi:hypothetical protein
MPITLFPLRILGVTSFLIALTGLFAIVDWRTHAHITGRTANVDAATALGFRAIRFTDATALRSELEQLRLLADTQGASPPG